MRYDSCLMLGVGLVLWV